MLLLHNIVFFLFPASGTDIPDFKIIREDLPSQRVLDPALHIRQVNIRDFPAPAANQVIVPFRSVVPVRQTRLGDAVQQTLPRQGVQMFIHGANGDAGMLPFHLQEHLLRRGMLLQLRYGGQYLLCVFWHTANPPNTRISLILLLLLYLYFFLCQQPQKACAPKAAPKYLDSFNCICYNHSINCISIEYSYIGG